MSNSKNKAFLLHLVTMKNTIKAVLFDLDDTLWAVNPVLERAERLMYEWLTTYAPKVAQKNSIADLRKRRKAMIEQESRYRIELWSLRYASLVQAFDEVGENPAGVDRAMTVFSKARSEVTLYEDVIPVLTKLQKKYATGSITNGFANLQQIGIEHYFHICLAAHQLGYAKPDAEIFHLACQQLHVLTKEAVFIGDDPENDIAGAKNAGLHAFWINRADLHPPRHMPNHIKPDAVLHSLYDLEYLLMS